MGELAFPLGIAGIALLPALLKLWWGRVLVRQADDPALPERLAAFRQRQVLVMAVATGLIVGLKGPGPWAFAFIVLSSLVAGFPARRALFGEQWGLGGYLRFVAGGTLAFWGFWLLLGATPMVMLAAGERRLLAAVGLGGVLLAWNTWHSRVIRALMGTEPATDPALLRTFGDLLAASTVDHPVRLDVLPMRGGTFANAVALPSAADTAGVAVTSTLLERCEPAEVRAILAHELAHIEHHTPARTRRFAMVTMGLVAVALLLVPGAAWVEPRAPQAVVGLWPLVLIAVLGVITHQRQGHETASDLRAVALGGDARALMRGLEKIHAAALMPRRLTTDLERRATHPSLARRLQAIAVAAGLEPAALTQPETFTTAAGASVTFQPDRLEWHEPGAEPHVLAYGAITELRLHTGPLRGPRLVAVEATGARRTLPIDPGDRQRLQATLDRVDGRLGHLPSSSPVAAVLAQMVALVVVLMALVGQALAVVLVAAPATFRATPPLLAAAGVGGVVGALTMAAWPMPVALRVEWVPLALGLAGLVACAAALANRREVVVPWPRWTLGVLAAVTAAAWVPILAAGADPLELYLRSRAWPAAVVLSAAMAAALAFMPSRGRRVAAALTATTTAVGLWLGTAAFGERFAGDPFVAAAPDLVASEGVAAPAVVAEHRLDAEVSVDDLWISPGGTAVAVASEMSSDDDDASQVRVLAGAVGGALAPFAADEARFLDDRRLLLLTREEDGTVLAAADLGDGGRETWRVRLPIYASSVWAEPVADRWHVLGAADNGRMVHASGLVGDPAVDRRAWPSSDDHLDVRPFAQVGDTLFGVSQEYEPPATGASVVVRLLAGAQARVTTTLWRFGRSAAVSVHSAFDVTCGAVPGQDAALCAAVDGRVTRLFRIGADAARPQPVGKVRGRLRLGDGEGAPWLAAWLDGRPARVRPDTGALYTLPRVGDSRAYLASTSGGVVATAAIVGDAAVLRVHRLAP